MMNHKKSIIYPYIPNSVPAIKKDMLKAINAKNMDELYADIPDELRLKRRLNLPEPYLSEIALRRHVEGLLARNKHCNEVLNFLGAGCYQHYVPAVCDEVNGRGEFLTAYAGDPWEDHGRFQALFEYASMMGELLEMDVVNVPTYDGFQAAATSLRMASRITGRHEVLISASTSADMLSKFHDYLKPHITLRLIDFDPHTGMLDLKSLKAALSNRAAAVYFENPTTLGVIEGQGAAIAKMAHASGAECVVYTDPIALGVLAPPAAYGADIACGDIQALGIHMQYGGGHGGFIATRDEEKYVHQYPSRLFGITSTSVDGEYGFGDVTFNRTSFARREQAVEWVGTAAGLWGITAGVYMALMGPQGFAEIGEGIMQRARYAALEIGKISGVKAPLFLSAHFKEFAVNFDGTGKTVAEINRGLLERNIFGGKDLSHEFPALGQSALVCVTEMHTQADIDRLAAALEEVIQ
jgi:glycine dehydrogenase subunit 1